MDHATSLTRRTVLKYGGVAGLTALGTPLLTSTAAAAGTTLPAPAVTDLGPAVEQFSLMSGQLIGDTVYIGSRNLDPPRVIAFHLPTSKVVARTDLTAGYSIQALAADPSGRYLYIGTLSKSTSEPANLHRWDVTKPDQPATALGRIDDRDVRDVTVAPDGTVFAVGGGGPNPPALWEYDPDSGVIRNCGTPDPKATLARAVGATNSTVFFGAGSILAGGGDTSAASLFAYDRAAGSFASIIPPELVADPSLRELAIAGDYLAIGTAGSSQPAHFAMMRLDDYTSYQIVTADGITVKTFAVTDDAVYYSTDLGLQAYSRTAGTVADIDLKGLDLGEIWGLDSYAGKLQVVSAYGFVAGVDPAAASAPVVSDLGAAGAPVDPQLVMGLATGGGYLYVGGTGTITRHSLRNGSKLNLQAQGEAKDALVLNGTLYTGQYDSQGIWSYDPSTSAGPHQVAQFPPGQNRPLDVEWDQRHRLILVAVQNDADGGGSIATYDPRTRKVNSTINPIDSVQLVRAVASADGVAYLGGDNAQKTGPRGTVVAWDPVARRELWRLESGQTDGVASLAAIDGRLYGLSLRGGFFVVDLRRRAVVHTENVRPICPGFSAMTISRGFVYAASDTTVFRFDPRTFAVTTVVPAINGGWYSGPHITADKDGTLYTMRGRNLVRIIDHRC